MEDLKFRHVKELAFSGDRNADESSCGRVVCGGGFEAEFVEHEVADSSGAACFAEAWIGEGFEFDRGNVGEVGGGLDEVLIGRGAVARDDDAFFFLAKGGSAGCLEAGGLEFLPLGLFV